LRNTWKEVGLGFMNLLVLVMAIAAVQPLLKRNMPGLAGALIMALLCLFVYTAASKWIERRTPLELEPGRALPEAGLGFVLGLLLFTVVMAVLWMVRVYHPGAAGWSAQVGEGLLSAVVAGVLEEILFRGLLFRLLAKILGTWRALLVTAALFGFVHAYNPGATLGSSVAIALEAGILLGAAYAATTRLWLPIGLHIGWNFTEGGIFGMSVSGHASGGLLGGTLTGPTVLTGGQFGPEASIVAVLVCLALALYFIRRTVKRGLVQPPVWGLPRR